MTTDGTSAEPPARRRVRGFSGRDLANVAIFAVLYFAVIAVVSTVRLLSPIVMLLYLPLAAVAAGIPYMLFLTRVRRPGMITLFGVVVGLFYMLAGHPWVVSLIAVVLAVIADLIVRAGGYRSTWAAIGGYTVFSLWFVGTWIPLLLDRDAYFDSLTDEGTSGEYMSAFIALIGPPAILGMAALTVVGGVLGGLLGTSLLRKHFRKAGLA